MKYLVNAGLHGSAFLGEFEASSEEEAIAKAEASAFLGLCRECSKLAQNLEIVFLTADIQNCVDSDGRDTPADPFEEAGA